MSALLKAVDYLMLRHDSPELQSREFRKALESVFTHLKNPNGTWKTTRRGRHRQIDAIVLELIRSKGLNPRVFLDIGVASGVTTAETINYFARNGLALYTIATDICLDAYVAQVNTCFAVLLGPVKQPLKFEVCGLSLAPHCSCSDYLSGLAWLKKGLNAYTSWSLRDTSDLSLSAQPSERQAASRPLIKGPFMLITPELQGRSDVSIQVDNILQPPPPALHRCADMVRIAHVLRPDRFTPAELTQAARGIRERCADHALVVVCRSNPRQRKKSPLEGTIFMADTPSGFTVLDRIGAGSEVERYFTNL